MDMKRAQSSATATASGPIVATLALSVLLASLGTSIANIALPTIADAFTAPFDHVQWVIVSYLAALTVSAVFVGRLGDRYGFKCMHLAGLGLFSMASLLCGIAPDLWVLVGGRAFQGIGAAFLMTLTMALARESAGEERTGRVMGMLGTMSALGTALGPSLGGVLIPVAGWQAVFLVQVPVAVLTLILAFVALPPDTASAKKDSVEGYPAAWERALLSNLSVNLLVAAVMMATLVVGPFYLGRGLGLSALSIGLVMSFGPLISILSGIPSGRAVDVWGTRRILALGLMLLAAGAFMLALLPMKTGVAGYVVAIAVLTPGYQLFQAANNTQVLTNVPKERRGVISGLLGLSRNLGLIVGASVMGAVFAWGAGTRDISQAPVPAIASGMQLTFLIAAGLMLAALWLALGAVRRGRDRPASGDGKGPL